MTVMPKTLVLLALAAVGLSACGSNTEIISQGTDQIAISIDSDKAMDDAMKEATEYCAETEKQAVLDRTETLDKTAIVYFNCQSAPAEPAPATTQ